MIDAYKFGIRINIPLPEESADTCSHINHKCPLRGGEDITFVVEEKIEGIASTSKAQLEIGIQGDDGRNFFCVRFGVKVHAKHRPELG